MPKMASKRTYNIIVYRTAILIIKFISFSVIYTYITKSYESRTRDYYSLQSISSVKNSIRVWSYLRKNGGLDYRIQSFNSLVILFSKIKFRTTSLFPQSDFLYFSIAHCSSSLSVLLTILSVLHFSFEDFVYLFSCHAILSFQAQIFQWNQIEHKLTMMSK